MKKILIKPDVCFKCQSKKPLDLANKNHLYNENENEWIWLCRKGHTYFDGKNFKKDSYGRFSKRINKNRISKKRISRCMNCHKLFYFLYQGKRNYGKFCSSKCYHEFAPFLISGKNNPNWRGGTSAKYRRILNAT
jgi:hypothetical protein